MSKQTACTQLLNAIPEASEIKDFIQENNADTKMLDEWLWERIYKGRDYLAMERRQIEEAVTYGQNNHSYWIEEDLMKASDYYSQTYQR